MSANQWLADTKYPSYILLWACFSYRIITIPTAGGFVSSHSSTRPTVFTVRRRHAITLYFTLQLIQFYFRI